MRVDGRDITVSGSLLKPLTRRTNDIVRVVLAALFLAVVITSSLITRNEWDALEKSVSEIVAVGDTPGEPGWGAEPRERWGRLGAEGDLREVPTEPGDYGAFYEGVAASLLGGAPPPVDPVDAVTVLELLEEARAASRSLST